MLSAVSAISFLSWGSALAHHVVNFAKATSSSCFSVLHVADMSINILITFCTEPPLGPALAEPAKAPRKRAPAKKDVAVEAPKATRAPRKKTAKAGGSTASDIAS